MGSVPKPAQARHNRRVRPAERILEAPTAAPPAVPEGRSWPASVREWWTRAWSSPVAAVWDPTVDLQTVARLGDLYAQLADGDGAASLHAQCARLESELMLTPRARKSAYVALRRDEPGETGGRPEVSTVEELRRRVRAVDPDLIDGEGSP